MIFQNVFLTFCILNTHAMPSGSSFGGVYYMRKTGEESEYAFDVCVDEFEEMRNLLKYKKYMESIKNFEEHTY